MVRRNPEPGVPFSAESHAYTYWLILIAWCGLWPLIRHDLGPDGSHILIRAYGLSPSWKLWTSVIVQFFLSGMTASAVSFTYHRFTGYHMVEDRIGYARAGGSDIANWCNLLINALVIFAFSYMVPAAMFGRLRPFVLVVAGILSSVLVARFLATAVFRAQFGEPLAH
jgi:hypothetical protein